VNEKIASLEKLRIEYRKAVTSVKSKGNEKRAAIT
jgi:hypothetical protein